jgi:hypothetical protein
MPVRLRATSTMISYHVPFSIQCDHTIGLHWDRKMTCARRNMLLPLRDTLAFAYGTPVSAPLAHKPVSALPRAVLQNAERLLELVNKVQVGARA